MSFCEKLKEALLDEKKASQRDYPDLADALYKESETVDRKTANDHLIIIALTDIQSDESRHRRVLEEIYERRCKGI
jgi:2-oxo-4-hydroxy-4-carboxy--5-ureidoimidazoline (OHCU) decarboxylase